MAIVLLGNVVGQKVAASANIAAFRSVLPSLIREAMENTFKYWFKKYAPKHFTRSAYNRYPDEYKLHFKINLEKFRKRYKRKLERNEQTIDPLVATGRLKQEFLAGSYTFGSQYETLKVKWPGLPQYAYKYHIGHFQKNKALTAVNSIEEDDLAKFFDNDLQKLIDKYEAKNKRGTRTFGRMAA